MSKALLKYVRLSPTKARLIAREIQGMNAEKALSSLEFTPNKAARIIAKVVASAVANGDHNAEDVVILSCRIDNGPVLRRFTPRAKGRATPIRKPTAHIFIEVDEDRTQKTKQTTKRDKVSSDTQEANDMKARKKSSSSSANTDSAQGNLGENKTKTVKTKRTSVKKKTEGEEK